MKEFAGFPAKTRFTHLPDLFFSEVLPGIDDLTELKLTLCLLRTLYRRRGFPRFVTLQELLGDRSLLSALEGGKDSPAAELRRGLGLASQRGTLLHLSLEREGRAEDLYFLNTEDDRRAMARIKSGELALGALPRGEPYVEGEERPNIFALYERNIGMLTPMIAEELKQAEEIYPPDWIEEAFKEAVSLNKRSWRYISRILERWAAEGKDDGEHWRDTKTKGDSAKYIKGRYGHLIQR